MADCFMAAVPVGLMLALFLELFLIKLIKPCFSFPLSYHKSSLVLFLPGFMSLITAYLPFSICHRADGWAVLADEDYATYGIIVAGLYPQIAIA